MLARWLVLALFASLLAKGQLFAQTDTCLRRTIPVNVLTRQAELVSGLTPQNFKSSFHHQPVKFLSITPDQSPQRVVIAIDASGSMTFDRLEWRYSLDVAKDFLSGIPANTDLGFVVFSTRIQTLIPLTKDRSKINEELVRLEAEKYPAPKKQRETALWDSLSAVLSESIPLQKDDSLYVLTDGQDNSSKIQFSKFRTTLLEKEIRFFAFSADPFTMPGGPSQRVMMIPDPRQALEALRGLAEATGGYAVHLSRNPVDRMPARLDNFGKPTAEGLLVLSQFRQAYSFSRVQVEFAEPLKKSQEWVLETNGLTAHNLVIFYPHMLAACTNLLQPVGATP